LLQAVTVSSAVEASPIANARVFMPIPPYSFLKRNGPTGLRFPPGRDLSSGDLGQE
jgi:hypothetical protein